MVCVAGHSAGSKKRTSVVVPDRCAPTTTAPRHTAPETRNDRSNKLKKSPIRSKIDFNASLISPTPFFSSATRASAAAAYQKTRCGAWPPIAHRITHTHEGGSMTRVGALGVAAMVMAGACNSANQRRGGGGGDGGLSGPCTDGEHRCDGRLWDVCQNGAFTTQQGCTSDQLCSDTLGCVACLPGKNGCVGAKVVTCDANGSPTQTVIQDCGPDLTCASDPASGQAACVTPCDPKALAHSYTGCVFYAVDLPQFTIPTPLVGTIAADQQFAIAVANPWQVPLNVVVERDDAMPGQPAQLAQVATAQVPAQSLQTIPLPPREVSGYVKGQRNRTLLTAAAYRVTTDRPASVYQFKPINNPDAFSNDASLLIPSNALDASYVVLGWPGTGGDVSAGGLTIQTDKRSYVTIVATRANTKVRVTASSEIMAGDNATAIHKGGTYTAVLNEFDTLNLEGADFQTAGATDFTGTRIEADGPLAVWSGVECMTINPDPPIDPMKTCCCDHLEEQLFPRSSLGHDYVVVRSEGRS